VGTGRGGVGLADGLHAVAGPAPAPDPAHTAQAAEVVAVKHRDQQLLSAAEVQAEVLEALWMQGARGVRGEAAAASAANGGGQFCLSSTGQEKMPRKIDESWAGWLVFMKQDSGDRRRHTHLETAEAQRILIEVVHRGREDAARRAAECKLSSNIRHPPFPLNGITLSPKLIN
jgi:hypothetical protein